jgi:hypothetical protein
VQGALAARGKIDLVSYEEQCGLGMLIQFKEERADTLASTSIKVAGRLVGEEDGGGGHECSGKCDSLLLTSGELTGVMTLARRKTDAIERR